jgi:heat shock protein HslJ/uncharacterized protein YecT (DUF1311 family)
VVQRSIHASIEGENVGRIGKLAIVLIAAFCGYTGMASATPLQDCAPSSVPMVCLDAKLKAANLQLNAALKAAQEHLEQLQAHGGRPVMGAFVDSQRKFNAYRDAQCNWQGIRAAPGANGADYVKDCQIRATLARTQELAEFAAGNDTTVTAATPPPGEPESRRAKNMELPPAGDQLAAAEPPDAQLDSPAAPAGNASAGSASAGARGSEWRLVKWVANGAEKQIAPDSAVTIAFDPSGKIAGNASVNRYSGTFRFDVDGRIEWSRAGFALTRMAGPQPLMRQEQAFLESLRRTVLVRADGQQLVLESNSGATVLTFTR